MTDSSSAGVQIHSVLASRSALSDGQISKMELPCDDTLYRHENVLRRRRGNDIGEWHLMKDAAVLLSWLFRNCVILWEDLLGVPLDAVTS